MKKKTFLTLGKVLEDNTNAMGGPYEGSYFDYWDKGKHGAELKGKGERPS